MRQPLLLCNRSDVIRTRDLCVPNAALYQTEPRFDVWYVQQKSLYRKALKMSIKMSQKLKIFLGKFSLHLSLPETVGRPAAEVKYPLVQRGCDFCSKKRENSYILRIRCEREDLWRIIEDLLHMYTNIPREKRGAEEGSLKWRPETACAE